MMHLALCYFLRCRAWTMKLFYFLFTGVIFNSFMWPGSRFWLEKQPMGRCIWHQEWGAQVCVKFLDDSDHSIICNAKGGSLWGRHSYISGVQVRCKKIEMMCLCQFNEHLNLHLGPCQWVGVSPMCWFDGCLIPIQSSVQVHIFDVLILIWAYLALAVRLMKIICQGLLLPMASSSCGHGTGWPQMWLMDSRIIFGISALICSGSSANG